MKYAEVMFIERPNILNLFASQESRDPIPDFLAFCDFVSRSSFGITLYGTNSMPTSLTNDTSGRLQADSRLPLTASRVRDSTIPMTIDRHRFKFGIR
jgi:hypothetical protein